MRERRSHRGVFRLARVFCVWSVVLAGCGFTAGMRQATGFSDPETPYGAALMLHTRKAEIYRDLDAVAKAHATWKGPALRTALAEASVAAYGLTGAAAVALRREEEGTARRIREFHVAFYTPKTSWNDLDSPDTLWRVHVELPDGTWAEPVQVSVVRKSDKSPLQYPYVTPWTREYSVFFPILDDTSSQTPPTLVIEGPLGRMTFSF